MGIYSEEHTIFQASIRKFAEREILPSVDAWEEQEFFPSTIFQKLGSAGFLGILMDEAWGGVGGDLLLAGAWCEEFGRIPSVGFTTGVNMHSLVITPTLARLGTKDAKERWLTKAVAGNAIGAYAFTEPGAGSDLSQVRTRAVRDGDTYNITGSKIFITNGKRADFILVLTRTDPDKGHHGFTTFVVDTKSPGFKVSRTLSKLGWHCSDTAELVFDNVRVGKECILGEVGRGWQQSMASLNWERLMLTLGAIGGAAACLESTIRYVNERKVFGKTVGSFEVVQDGLTRYWSRIQAGRAFAHQCLRKLKDGIDCRLEVSLCKWHVCQMAIELADYCLQLHGGYGYTTEFRPERWLRDLRLNTIGGGTNEIMAEIASKELFKAHA